MTSCLLISLRFACSIKYTRIIEVSSSEKNITEKEVCYSTLFKNLIYYNYVIYKKSSIQKIMMQCNLVYCATSMKNEPFKLRVSPKQYKMVRIVYDLHTVLLITSAYKMPFSTQKMNNGNLIIMC